MHAITLNINGQQYLGMHPLQEKVQEWAVKIYNDHIDSQGWPPDSRAYWKAETIQDVIEVEESRTAPVNVSVTIWRCDTTKEIDAQFVNPI